MFVGHPALHKAAANTSNPQRRGAGHFLVGMAPRTCSGGVGWGTLTGRTHHGHELTPEGADGSSLSTAVMGWLEPAKALNVQRRQPRWGWFKGRDTDVN
jgi:hypothetical protein